MLVSGQRERKLKLFSLDPENFHPSRQGRGWQVVKGGVVPSPQHRRVRDLHVSVLLSCRHTNVCLSFDLGELGVLGISYLNSSVSIVSLKPVGGWEDNHNKYYSDIILSFYGIFPPNISQIFPPIFGV